MKRQEKTSQTSARLLNGIGGLGEEAKAEVAQATTLVDRNESPKVRLKMEMIAAEVLSAGGKPDDAARNLRRTIKDAQKTGFFVRQLEATLTLAGIEAKSGRKAQARALLQSVEQDARRKGYLLLAQEAVAGRS